MAIHVTFILEPEEVEPFMRGVHTAAARSGEAYWNKVKQALVLAVASDSSGTHAAALEVCDVPGNVALQQARYVWQSEYLGAFIAFGIDNESMAKELAALTLSDAEAFAVIAIMRDAKPGDRVYPALDWLRSQRKPATP